MKHFLSALVAICAVVLALMAGYWFNIPGLHFWLSSVNSALAEILGSLFIGLKILFFTGLTLGSTYAVVQIRGSAKRIGPTKYGQLQAVVHKGELIQFQTSTIQQIDPLQQLALLQRVITMQSSMQKLAQQSSSVKEIASPIVDAAPESIGAIVKYEEVRDEVPEGMSLLGIHPSDGLLELADYEKLKCLWVVGSSSTGKSNTVYGKALEAKNHGAKIMLIDQHINKPDSLAKKLAPLADSYLMPVAVSDQQAIEMLLAFKHTFERRVNGEDCSQKIVLIIDEMNRLARSENVELVKLLKNVVAICGEESRGFGMYGWFISQKAAHLKWLRDSAITVIAHRLTMLAEAKLACNDDLDAARKLLRFPIGRSYVYGVDFDEPMELQQPLYEVEPITLQPDFGTSPNLPDTEKAQQWEANGEAIGSAEKENEPEPDMSVKILRDIGKRLRAGESKAEIIKRFGLPYGRATQELSAAIDLVLEQIDKTEE